MGVGTEGGDSPEAAVGLVFRVEVLVFLSQHDKRFDISVPPEICRNQKVGFDWYGDRRFDILQCLGIVKVCTAKADNIRLVVLDVSIIKKLLDSLLNILISSTAVDSDPSSLVSRQHHGLFQKENGAQIDGSHRQCDEDRKNDRKFGCCDTASTKRRTTTSASVVDVRET